MIKKCLRTTRGNVAYWISEDRKENAIVFSHGLTADHTLFDEQIEFFSKYYTVLTWDMPLHGESTKYIDFTIKNTADDLNEILKLENISHIVIAGQSGGGYNAQAFALYYPKKTDAFISIDSTPLGPSYYKKSELFWTNHYSAVARCYPYSVYCKMAAKAATVTQKARESFYQDLLRLGKKAMLRAANEWYHDFIHYPEVPFQCPVLLLLGDQDQVGYVAKYTRDWTKKTGYPLVMIPNAGHNSNYDNAEFFNKTVFEFLQKNNTYHIEVKD